MQKMQKDMQKTQAELAEKEVEASVGGGQVVVKANGAGGGDFDSDFAGMSSIRRMLRCWRI